MSKPKLYPTSVRFTATERDALKKAAGKQPLSAFIREKALDGEAETLARRPARKAHQPTLDHKILAQLLAVFGQSELGRSMIALSMAAQIGALECDEETQAKLDQACDDIHDMRNCLIMALGIKPQGGHHDP